MEKIFTLRQKDFFTGIAMSPHLENSGLFYKAEKINPFVYPEPQQKEVGILQMSADPTDKTGSVVLDSAIAGDSRVTAANTGNLYLLGDSGHLYSIDLNTETVSDVRSTTISSPANGFKIFKSIDGDEFAYYFRQTKIGRWDLSSTYPTGWTDDWDTGLEDTAYHPTHFFKGAVFFGNKNYIGKIYSVSGSGATTATTGTGALGLPSDFLTTCFEDDGNYLIAGITKNKGDDSFRADTRIIFWDTIVDKFNHEWSLPDFTINSIKRFENGFLAFSGKGVYFFNFYTKPQRVRILGTGSGTTGGVSYGFPYSVDNLGDVVVWGSGTKLNTYGRMIPEAPNAYFQPFAGLTGGVTFVDSKSKFHRIWVATSTPKLYLYNIANAGGTSATYAETIYLDLNDEWDIKKFDFILAEPLANGDPGDTLTLQTQIDENNTAENWGTFSPSSHGTTTKRIEVFKDGGLRTNILKLLFGFIGGNVKIKKIEAYGERIRRIED